MHEAAATGAFQLTQGDGRLVAWLFECRSRSVPCLGEIRDVSERLVVCWTGAFLLPWRPMQRCNHWWRTGRYTAWRWRASSNSGCWTQANFARRRSRKTISARETERSAKVHAESHSQDSNINSYLAMQTARARSEVVRSKEIAQECT